MEYIVLGIIIAIGVGLFYYGIKRKNKEAFVTYFLRMAGGALGIYLTNTILKSLDFHVQVGLNTYNLLALGVLGVPGYLMLYGISTYFTLKM